MWAFFFFSDGDVVGGDSGSAFIAGICNVNNFTGIGRPVVWGFGIGRSFLFFYVVLTIMLI